MTTMMMMMMLLLLLLFACIGSEIVIKQKEIPFGVDPKSIVCEFFKAKKCTKGAKCKVAINVFFFVFWLFSGGGNI